MSQADDTTREKPLSFLARASRAVLRHGWASATCVLIVLFLAVTSPIWSGRAIPNWDADGFFAPSYMLVADFIRNGRIMLWNPWTSAGSPDGCEPQFGTCSPVYLLSGLLTGGTMRGFVIYWLTSWLVGGLGMLALLRALNMTPWGGFVGACAFTFSGFMLGHAEHTSSIVPMTFLPWILWRIEKGGGTSSRHAMEAGGLWGLSALAGYPGIVLITGGITSVWLILRNLLKPTSKQAPREYQRIILCLILFALVGITVLAPPYAMFLKEFQGYTPRTGVLDRSIVLESNPTTLGSLLSFCTPYSYAWECYNYPEPWGPISLSCGMTYLPMFAAWLALTALVVRPKDPWRLSLVILSVLAIMTAMSTIFPLRGWLYDYFPLTRFFRHSAMFRGVSFFCIAILAATACCLPSLRPMRWRIIGCAMFVSAGYLATFLIQLHPLTNPGPKVGLAFVILLTSSVLLIVSSVLMTARTALLQRVGMGILLTTCILEPFAFFKLAGHIVYNDEQPIMDEWTAVEAHHTSSIGLEATGGNRVTIMPFTPNIVNAKHLLIKMPVLLGYNAAFNPIFEEWVRDPLLCPMIVGTQRIWFAKSVVETQVNTNTFRQFKESVHQNNRVPLLIQSRDELAGRTTSPPGTNDYSPLPSVTPADAEIIRYQPDELILRVKTDTDGWLWVTDRWARGWTAEVNDQPTELWCGNFVFRAVQLSEGTHLVRFSYHPWGYPWLLVASWSTLLALLIRAVSISIRTRRETHNSGHTGNKTS